MELLQQVFDAGVVGAGGAGFPTHKKLTDQAHTLIVNAAECEPLLASDRYVMRHFAKEITKALMLVQREFGMERVIIGTKAKYTEEIEALQKAFNEEKVNFEICGVDSFYPAGDEQTLIYEITGETVPPGGIPLALGIVVINVTTAYNIYRANLGIPVTHQFVTVNGEVGEAVIVHVPVGTSVLECIEAAGGTPLQEYSVIMGGPMMGKQNTMEQAKEINISKRDSGMVILPADHPLITFSQKPVEHMINQARSVCIQCSYCTELCPRYLIGHQMRPHRVMRSMATDTCPDDLTDALLCCECGICELFSCPMELSPRRMNVYVKGVLREKGIKSADPNIYPAHSELQPYRKIAQNRFINRLELTQYPTHIYKMVEYQPKSASIPLSNGIGKPSTPAVKVGDRVKVGDLIATVEFQEMGNLVHASIDGVVTNITNKITIERE